MLSLIPNYSGSNYRAIIDNCPINRWPQDEINILDGNCSFCVDYLGCVEVSEPTNSQICCESFAKLYREFETGICHANPSVLWITGYELRVVEKKSKNLVLAQIMENVLFCATTTHNSDQLFYTCRDTYNDRWLCYLFVVKRNMSDRLCKAIGFAFRMCERRKIIREGLETNMTTKNNRSTG
ncbi:PTB/PI domain,PH domain-like [Cinara cedri]|uniref:PTB/PI domain,PH domain-like n=1 Tax=Cinara cedri TaxID=506608 RepID=A0A5E4NS16_9HEMI|nr:PTB/PI domain,PH domain-like [Cinara cedri]